MAITIDKDACIGCGVCTSVCEKCFEMKEGKAVVKKGAAQHMEDAKKAAESCPVDAIKAE